MKKIINGKVYDTETAKKIGDYTSPHARNDFRWYSEELYRKKTGEFFVYGKGNGASPYAVREFDGWTYGKKIEPLSYSEAQKWTEEHLDADEYIKIFGEPAEDDSKQCLNLYLRKDTINKLKQMSAQQNKAVSELIEEMFR